MASRNDVEKATLSSMREVENAANSALLHGGVIWYDMITINWASYVQINYYNIRPKGDC